MTVIVLGASTMSAVRRVDPKDQVILVITAPSAGVAAIAVTSEPAERDGLMRVGNA